MPPSSSISECIDRSIRGRRWADYAGSTTSTVPLVPVTLTRAPAGASGPSTGQSVSPTRTLPRPYSIACSTTTARPTYCWPRTLRSGRSLIATSGRTNRFTQNRTTTERRTKASTCHGQVMPTPSATMPMTAAARPNHRKCTPGITVSRARSTTARISQFHAPRLTNSAHALCMKSLPTRIRTQHGVSSIRHAARPGARHRAGARAAAVLAERLAGDLAEARQRADHARGIQRHHQHLLVGRLRQRLQRLHVVVGDEIVDRLHVARRDGLADQLGGLGLRLGGALARLGIAEGGLAAALRRQHNRLLLALGLEDGGLAMAFSFQALRALVALGLHLARHAVDQVARRGNVLDLDARHFHAPGLGGGIHHLQQARIDLVAVGEQLV